MLIYNGKAHGVSRDKLTKRSKCGTKNNGNVDCLLSGDKRIVDLHEETLVL